MTTKNQAHEPESYAVDAVAWESFVRDWGRYVSGDARMPFGALREGIAAVIDSAAAVPAHVRIEDLMTKIQAFGLACYQHESGAEQIAMQDEIRTDLTALAGAIQAPEGEPAEPNVMASGWTPVHLGLPPKFAEVMIAFAGSALPSTGQYTGNLRDSADGWSYPSENSGDDTDWTVTHWRPLPEHPEAYRFAGSPDAAALAAVQSPAEGDERADFERAWGFGACMAGPKEAAWSGWQAHAAQARNVDFERGFDAGMHVAQESARLTAETAATIAEVDARHTQPKGTAGDDMTDEQVDRILSASIPGGSAARDWFLPHEQAKGLANVRDVVRRMAAEVGNITGNPYLGNQALEEAWSDNEELRSKLEEAQQEPWPEWADNILKMVRQCSGYDGFDDASEGVDLPEEVRECLEALAQEAKPMAAIGPAAVRAGYRGDMPVAEFVCARLQAPAPAPEPVAEVIERCMDEGGRGSKTIYWRDPVWIKGVEPLPIGAKLYAGPVPAPAVQHGNEPTRGLSTPWGEADDSGGDEMLEPLIYAAMMHNGKPKTVAEFERAAANVAGMLERRAEVTHNKPVASIYISDDGSREFDDWRVDLPPGNHQLFTAPRPDQPQPESLPHPGAPEAEEMIEKLLAECNRPSNMKNAARAGYMAAKRLLQHARQPLPATDDAEPNVQSKGTAVDLHSLIGDLEYAAKTHAHHGTLHTRDGLHAARKALMAAFQAPAVGDATP